VTHTSGVDRDFVFYDGGCALCHATVRFFLRRDPGDRLFVFAPLGGKTFEDVFGTSADESATHIPDSVVVRTADNRTLLRSRAVSHMLRRSGWPWSFLGMILLCIPSPLADAGYAVVARSRRTLFGTPDEWCPVPEGPDRHRFRR
jgi:predicted DCC family thiol-disulfide oxidoreductase YuxK